MRASELLESAELKSYSIIVPPTDLEKCKNLIGDTFEGDGPFNYVEDGKDVETDDARDWAEHLPTEQLRHEAIHALQDKQIPEIFKDLPELDLDGVDWDNFDDNPDKKKVYMSRHPEIMAFAFDTANGIEAEDSIKEYERIGGSALKLFQHYVKEYEDAS